MPHLTIGTCVLAWLQVGDLCLARVLPSEATYVASASSLGPVKWMSPESFLGEYSCASDVYMFGVTLLELVTRQEPFPGDRGPALTRYAQSMQTHISWLK